MKFEDLEKFEGPFKPKKGKIIISEPYLKDPNFERSVVFLCEHNQDGSYGLVLNKPIENISLSDVVDGVEGQEYSLFLGGPVEPDILQFLHKDPSFPGALQITDELFIGGDFEHLISLINHKAILPQDVKFFLGYSGWGEGQLDDEIKLNAWVVGNVDSDTILEYSSENLWRKVLRQMGGKFKFMSNYPDDPRQN